MTSGLRSVTSLSASSPSAALPTTSTSGWPANTSAMLRRLYAESSTTRSRMGAVWLGVRSRWVVRSLVGAARRDGLSVHEVVSQV